MVSFKIVWQGAECYYDSLGNVLFAQYIIKNGKLRRVSSKHKKVLAYFKKEGKSRIAFWERFPSYDERSNSN